MSERADSTGSSLLSTTTTVIANDIIHEYGDAMDYSENKCAMMYNIVDMCWINKFPSQKEMYFEMLKNKHSGLVGCMDPVEIDESFDDTSQPHLKRGFTDKVNINKTFDEAKSRS